MELIHLFEGLRMFKRRVKIIVTGIKRYNGTSKQICEKILKKCWNGKYFMVSGGHFSDFYCRDFGWVCKALINLGYKEEVRKTLDYALSKFMKHGRIRVAISPGGKPFDFPRYAPDSLAFILNSLRILGDKKLVLKYKSFLNNEVRYFFKNVVDETTGLVKKDKHFSSMKDYSIRQSSCYDNCMCYLVQKNSGKLSLFNPLRKYNYKELIRLHFWANDYFLDDLSGKTYVSGDAQILPFWIQLFDDKDMFSKVLAKIEKDKLNEPMAMKYTAYENKEHDMISVEVINKNYEQHVIWAHMGMMWLDVLYKFNKTKLKDEMSKYEFQIEKYRNFMEVYNPDLSLFKGPFYVADDSMSWCAVWLNYKKRGF